jgi:hypothetical protein
VVSRKHDQQRISVVPGDPDRSKSHRHGGIAPPGLDEHAGSRQARLAPDGGHVVPGAHHPDLIPPGDPARSGQGRCEQSPSPDELEEVLGALLAGGGPETLPRPTGQDDGVRASAAASDAG